MSRSRPEGPLAFTPIAARARFAATAMSTSDGHTSSTSPILRALCGRMFFPVRMRSSAVVIPTSLGSRWVPPPAGMTPIFTSGCPSTVFLLSVAMRIPEAKASSQPPPRQAPSIAATTGLPCLLCRSSMRWKRPCPAVISSSASEESSRVNSQGMSAPARKLLRFAEPMTSALISVSVSTRSMISASSAPKSGEMEFTGESALSMSTVASPSSIVTVKCL
ncbi:hypothetical protein BMS3Bbin02_00152 [bacterium BMS3Bbin02]|nr:hypothetical protein BMS3Bbin02_00152 [bacterium BMS3Bbin02]